MQKLSKGSQDLLEGASFEVTNMHHSEVGPEHLLLAMLSKTDNGAYRVLNSLGITYESVSPFVLGTNRAVIGIDYSVVPFNPSAAAIVNEAVKIAKASGQKLARPSHLLEALLRSTDSFTLQLLNHLQIDPGKTLPKVADMIKQEEN